MKSDAEEANTDSLKTFENQAKPGTKATLKEEKWTILFLTFLYTAQGLVYGNNFALPILQY